MHTPAQRNPPLTRHAGGTVGRRELPARQKMGFGVENMAENVELLAPAGNYDAFLGALNAGADAVYLGGDRFGARAYADNFDTKQIVRALHVAHFYGKKIYLTVNTLLKERELAELSSYLAPFYEAGLDGVIVQDFGVFCHIREHFPKLPLHVSTQMAVTGARGAAFLKEQGACRIVPARELSLEEVRKIKQEAGVEVECFIHGAMCYCYSGQCLFSSILGGRSGNRGRCAQPCRLPYEIYNGDKRLSGSRYPLSLKDMCTLEYLPKLLAAGIDSFKIEGRMKRPEYAAGVTEIYRKYIDLYYREGAARYQVDPADMDRLRSLYIRSEIQTGYYERHNGREMITFDAPGYSGSDEGVLAQIREAYVREPEKMPARMQVTVQVGEPLRLRITAAKERGKLSESRQTVLEEEAGYFAEVSGETVQTARNAPLTEETVRKQMEKTGESLVSVSACEIRMEGEGFVPVRALNELRREAVDAFERAVIAHRNTNRLSQSIIKRSEERTTYGSFENSLQKPADCAGSMNTAQESQEPSADCLVSTLEQLQAVAEWGRCRRIYIDSDLLLRESEKIRRITENAEAECHVALPYIFRERDGSYVRRLTACLADTPFSGALLRNLEELAYMKTLKETDAETFGSYELVPDAGLYCFNSESARFLSAYGGEITLPYELNAGEARHLVRALKERGMGANLIVYSRIPMMVTANCLQKTADLCPSGAGKQSRIFVKDRYGATFPVVINCDHCYNVLYNSVPFSLHGAKKERDRIGAVAFRYDFMMETGAQCRQILDGKFPFETYTAGHCKRGVE